MQSGTHHEGSPRPISATVTTGRVVFPVGEDRAKHIALCLTAKTVTVVTNSGRVITDCAMMVPHISGDDGFLMLFKHPPDVDAAGITDEFIQKRVGAGWEGGALVAVFPLDGSPFSALICPISIGSESSRFRLWSEHQVRDRHTSPKSTVETMIDGEGGFNFFIKAYQGKELFDETPAAQKTGTSVDSSREAREDRLVATTRVRITPTGKVILSTAKAASELESVGNLERVKADYSALDRFDDENSPHITIDPGHDGAPVVHIDSKDAELTMTTGRVVLKQKDTQNEMVMEAGNISITAGQNGVIELNGAFGKVLSTMNLPACLVTGTPFRGSQTEKTKG